MHNKIGFTLAEVLITLVIIGVIASLTIPNIIANTQQAEFKTKWKKEYSVLSQIAGRLYANGEIPDTARSVIMSKFGNYLSYIKKCEGTDKSCWHSANTWSRLSNDIETYGGCNNSPCYILSDGTLMDYNVIDEFQDPENCNPSTAAVMPVNYCLVIRVDVNGFKGPNRFGYDIYSATLYRDRLVPNGSPKTKFICDRSITGFPDAWDVDCSYQAIIGQDY